MEITLNFYTNADGLMVVNLEELCTDLTLAFFDKDRFFNDAFDKHSKVAIGEGYKDLMFAAYDDMKRIHMQLHTLTYMQLKRHFGVKRIEGLSHHSIPEFISTRELLNSLNDLTSIAEFVEQVAPFVDPKYFTPVDVSNVIFDMAQELVTLKG